jgi:membrane fusion protein (multidrug efflux system)
VASSADNYEIVETAGPVNEKPTGQFVSRNKKAVAAVGVFFLIALAGGHLWRYYASQESTDNAFVEGRVSPVSAVVPGTVRRVLVDDNEEVKEGQVLVELDPKYYRALLEQAKAAVAMAKSQLKAAVEQVSYTSETVSGQIAQAEAACQTASLAIQATHHIRDRAKAVLDYKGEALAVAEAGHQERQALEEKARIDYDRMSRLLEKKAISGLESDIAKLDYDAASARVTAANSKVLEAGRELEAASADLKVKESGYAYSPIHLGVKAAEAKAVEAEAKLTETRAKGHSVGIREAEQAQATAHLEEAFSNLKDAEHRLEDTVLRAHMAGRVTKKTVEVGQVVYPGQPLMAVVSLRDLWIVANFKETQLANLRPGQTVKITVDTYPGKVFTGTVESIQAGTGARFGLLPPENATGNFVKVVQRIPVKIVLDEHPNAPVLRLGMSVVPTVELR